MKQAEVNQIQRDQPELVAYGKERLEEILRRSATDQAFRQQLLADSRAAMSSHFGQDLPEELNVVFVENHGDATIVLPDPIDTNAELSDAELESVAGGVEPVTTICAAIAIGSALYVIGKKLFF